MPVEVIDHVKHLDHGVLIPIVRGLLNDESASPKSGWTAKPIGRSVGPGTLGIFQMTGEANTDGGPCPWSVVAKVMELGAKSEMFAHTTPDQEVQAYEHGLLAAISAAIPFDRSFRAAKHYGISEVAGLGTILWVEDLSAAPPPPWDDATYVEVGRHIGHFNANWELNKPERQKWFLDDGFTSRIEPQLNNYGSIGDFTYDALVERAAPPDVVRNMSRLAETMPLVLEVLNAGPRPLSHVDTQPRNLFPMPLERCGFETVAIDWASIGYAPLGTDAAQLVGSSLTWCEIGVERGVRLLERALDGYLTGLEEMSWSGNADLVRLAFMTSAITRAAGNLTFTSNIWMGHPEAEVPTAVLMGLPATTIADQWREVFRAEYPLFLDAVRSAGV